MALISKEDLLTKFETGALLFQPEVKRIIKIQPEVDAEPVRHGRWVKGLQSFVFPNKFGNYMCSECEYDVEKHRYNYCPNCGAKMDGGVE